MRATCCICSDILDEVNPISAAPCGHVFHLNCLMLWIGQSHTCPVCRNRVNIKNVLTLYFNFATTAAENASILENEIFNLKGQLSAKNIELEKCKKQKDEISVYVREAEKKAADLQQLAYKHESEITKLRLNVKSLSELQLKNYKLEQMNVALTNDLQHLNNVQSIVNGTQNDVETILQECGGGSETSRQMATYCTVLKRELQKVMDSKNKLLELNTKLKQENCRFNAKVKFYEEALAISRNSEAAMGKIISPAGQRAPLHNLKLDSNSSPGACNNIIPKIVGNSDKADVDISPLSVPFTKSKFNMCIVPTSGTSYKAGTSSEVKGKNLGPLPTSNNKDNNSVIRTGYNGLGGHSNFINTSSGIKKFRSLKRKI